MKHANSTIPALDKDGARLVKALHASAKGRAELATETGWSRNTVNTKLERLIDIGWVIEALEERGSRGRPFVRYALNPEAGLIYVPRFDLIGLHGTICTLDGRILATNSRPVPREIGADRATVLIEDALEELLEQPGIERSRLRAMILGVPGPVENLARTVPWTNVGVLPDDLGQRLGLLSAVENDANLMAIGERKNHPAASSILYIFAHTGLGAGLALAGGIHRGMSGWAGEIGHIPLAAAGDMPCSCGNRGCLATVVSNSALIRAISTPEHPVETVSELRQLVISGDTHAVVTLRQAGRYIGEAISGLVIGLAPDAIVVGGHLTQVGDHVIAGIREMLAQKTPPAISSRIPVTGGSGDHARSAVIGAAELALSLILEDPEG